MSSSPLPKKGSFSNLLSLTTHKKNSSSKVKLSTSPPPLHALNPAAGYQFKDCKLVKSKTSESSLSGLKSQVNYLLQKNQDLKEKLKKIQNLLNNPQNSIKNLSKPDWTDWKQRETEETYMSLIDSLFLILDEIFMFSLNSCKLQDLELRLIQEFQEFQKRTERSTGGYVQRIMKWRHQFNDSLMSPAESSKEDLASKKLTRSVSSIIASSVKNYAVCLKDHQGKGEHELRFRKGEIVEIVREDKDLCVGRVGTREGAFSKELVKIV